MFEEDDAIVVRASVPGLKREDVYLREHRYGRIERRMVLPRDVDAGAATATFEDGVLTLELPTRGDGDHRQIDIQGDG